MGMYNVSLCVYVKKVQVCWTNNYIMSADNGYIRIKSLKWLGFVFCAYIPELVIITR